MLVFLGSIAHSPVWRVLMFAMGSRFQFAGDLGNQTYDLQSSAGQFYVSWIDTRVSLHGRHYGTVPTTGVDR